MSIYCAAIVHEIVSITEISHNKLRLHCTPGIVGRLCLIYGYTNLQFIHSCFTIENFIDGNKLLISLCFKVKILLFSPVRKELSEAPMHISYHYSL